MQGSCVNPSVNPTWRPSKPCVHRTHRRPLHKCAAGSADPIGGLPEQSPQQPQQQQQQQQQQQPTQSLPVIQQQQKGPQAAPAQQPGDSREQLWWVEKFEEKRKQLQQRQQQPTSSSDTFQAPDPQAAAAAAGRKAQPIPWPEVALQLLQLVVAVAALILWPASLYRSGLYNAKIWLLFWTYLLFFGGGSVWRLLQYGPLASRKKDQQAKSLGTRAAWALFVAMMPVLHWGAIGSYIKGRAAAAVAAVTGGQQGSVVSGFSLYDMLGLAMLVGAVRLNWVAARHLGKAYDRVVQPEALVTTGPYRWMQHPIYSSYILLFCGYAMMLHSVGYALLALVVCLVYYKSRVALEGDVLREAFGEQYEQYQQTTKLFVPGLL